MENQGANMTSFKYSCSLEIFEVFMLKSTPGCDSSAGIQAEHFLEHDIEMLKQ